jgi:O-antigen/teichoic acid export membrane protein
LHQKKFGARHMKAIFSPETRLRLQFLLGKLTVARRELTWVISGQLLAAMAALAGVRLMTGLLSPIAYGQLALGMTVALLISQTLYGPLTNGIARYYAPASERGDLGSYLQASWKLIRSLTNAIVLAAAFLMVGAAIYGRTQWIALGITALIFSVLSGYIGIISGIQNAARQRSIVALHQAAVACARFAFAALLISLLGATSTIAFLGYAIGTLVVLISQFAFFRRVRVSSVGSNQDSWHGQILRYAWPFYSWSLFTWAQLSSDRWALAIFADPKDVGLYAALFQLGNNPIAMASTMVLQLLAPIFYQRAGDGTDRQRNIHVGKLGWYCALVALGATGVAVLGALLAHDGIFRLLVAAKYASVSPLLPYMFLASGLFVGSQMIELSLMSQMKTRMMVVAKITAAVAGVALNLVGAFLYGIEGVVAAGVTTSAFYFLWLGILSRRLLAHHAVEI